MRPHTASANSLARTPPSPRPAQLLPAPARGVLLGVRPGVGPRRVHGPCALGAPAPSHRAHAAQRRRGWVLQVGAERVGRLVCTLLHFAEPVGQLPVTVSAVCYDPDDENHVTLARATRVPQDLDITAVAVPMCCVCLQRLRHVGRERSADVAIHVSGRKAFKAACRVRLLIWGRRPCLQLRSRTRFG